jgi:peptidoglycan/xylan/chitin deacetylase (PgdA/CDA1 family)
MLMVLSKRNSVLKILSCMILIFILILITTGCSKHNTENQYENLLDTHEEITMIIEQFEDADIEIDFSLIEDIGLDFNNDFNTDISEPLEPIEPGDIIYITIQNNFVIYSIEGTSSSVTGERWDSMQQWREDAVELADIFRDTVIINMNPEERIVYLTFDDGPDPVNTISVINTLNEYNVSATFFFTGENMQRHPDIVQKTYDFGFTIGTHSYNHPRYTDLSMVEIIDDMNKTNDILESIIGSRSSFMRPPYGAVNSREIEIIRDLGYLIYLWSLDTMDWAQENKMDILQTVKDNLRPGDIILLHTHPRQSNTAEILPEIIEFILEQGFEIKALPG